MNNFNDNQNNKRSFTFQTNDPEEIFKRFPNFMDPNFNGNTFINDEPKYGNNPFDNNVVYGKEKYSFKPIIFTSLFAFIILTTFVFSVGLFSGTVKDEVFEHLLLIALYSLIGGICIGAGLTPPVNGIIKTRRCKQKVSAQIASVRVEKDTYRNSDGRRRTNKSYYPTYRYNYNGKVYLIEASTNRHIGKPMIGKNLQLRINEHNPKDFYVFAILRDAFITLLAFSVAYGISLENLFTAYL